MAAKHQLKIFYVPVEKIKFDPNNARTHSDYQIQQIADSIKTFGMNNPVGLFQLGDGMFQLVFGEGRVQGAKLAGLREVPAVSLDHLSERERRAYALADNRIALNSGWNFDRLNQELSILAKMDFDLGITGFDEQEIDAILRGDPGLLPNDFEGKEIEVASHKRKQGTRKGLIGDDEIPEPPPVPTTVPGDVWQLGEHRLACCDSRDAKAIKALLDGGKPPLMITDPPYGVEYEAGFRNRIDGGNRKAVEAIANDSIFDWGAAFVHFPGSVAYVWHGSLYASEVCQSLKDLKFDVRAQIIWAKQQFVVGQGHYNWQHEPCWYMIRKGKKAEWIGDSKQSTLWEFPNLMNGGDDARTGHSTQKPVEAFLRPMMNHEGDVLDLFGGSGTCLIAAEKLRRRCYVAELSPVWCDVAIKRWQMFTGLDAIRQDGKTFNSLTND